MTARVAASGSVRLRVHRTSRFLRSEEIDFSLSWGCTLTMERRRQLVATYGNGFGLFVGLRASGDLQLIATGCNHRAP
jgi:hypothetical protein